MNDSQSATQRTSGCFALPHTRLGWAAIWLTVGFLALMGIFFWQAQTPRECNTFFDCPTLSVPIVGAGIMGIAGGIAAWVDFVVKRDRSLLLVPIMLLGLVVLFFAVGESLGHD